MSHNKESNMQLVEVGVSSIDDVELIINECANWLAAHGMNHWKNYYTRQRILAKLHSPKSKTYLLMDVESGVVVATVTLGTVCPPYYRKNPEGVDYRQMFSLPDAQALYVTALGVRPAFQGKGYAKELMRFADEEAVRLGIAYVRFDARADYQELVRFYLNLGYALVGEMPDEGDSYYLFEKRVV